MPDDFSDIFDSLAKDIADEAKLSVSDARDLLAEAGPLVFRWEADARAADAEGNTTIATKKRQSIQHVKAGVILDVATHSVVGIDKLEHAILAAFDKALAMLP